MKNWPACWNCNFLIRRGSGGSIERCFLHFRTCIRMWNARRFNGRCVSPPKILAFPPKIGSTSAPRRRSRHASTNASSAGSTVLPGMWVWIRAPRACRGSGRNCSPGRGECCRRNLFERCTPPDTESGGVRMVRSGSFRGLVSISASSICSPGCRKRPAKKCWPLPALFRFWTSRVSA